MARYNKKQNIEIICAKCKKVFWVQPHRANTAKYCSRLCQNQCQGIGRNVKMTDDTKKKIGNANIGKQTEKICLNCESIFIVNTANLSRKYCSLKCYGKSKAGDKNNNWKGGIENKKVWTIQRRAKQRNAEGSHSLSQWEDLKKKFNYMCLCCKKYEPEVKLTEDHIIPLVKGGSNDISNIQPLCKSCNSRKHTKIISYLFNPIKIYDN